MSISLKNLALALLFAGQVSAFKSNSTTQQKQNTQESSSITSDPAIFASNLQTLTDEGNSAEGTDSSINVYPPISTGGSTSDSIEDIIDQIGSTCSENEECNGSTFCCSKGRCVPGSICYKGQKQAYDHCDYGFECLSRCCASTMCSPVIQCVETCTANADCADEPCCSFGYCTGSASICESGMKEDYDQCEAASECESGRCTNGRCTSNEIQVSNQLSLNVMIIMVFLMLIIVVTTCYYSKMKSEQAESMSHYRRSRRDGSSDTSVTNQEPGRRRRDSDTQRRHRNSSNSTERRHRQRSVRTDESPRRRDSDFEQHRGRRSRGLSDSNGKSSSDKLSKENLDRLSRQANSVKQPSNSKDRQPALLFVEDDQELMNQLGSSFNATNPRSSDLVRATEDKEGRMTDNEGQFSQDLTQAGTEITREKNE